MRVSRKELIQTVPKKGDLVELEIGRLLAGGVGAAQDGRMTFQVFGVLPGDLVRARIRRIKGSRIVAEAEEIVREAFPRKQPRCSHFGVCGGCIWQNVPYPDQLRLKTGFVQQCFEEAGLPGRPVREILGCESPFYYRNKMEFAFGGVADPRRDGEGKVGLGLHIRGRYDRIFDLKECFLQSERSSPLVGAVRHWANEHALSAYDLRSHRGLLRFLMVREGKLTGETMVNLVVSEPGFSGQEAMAREIMAAHPQVTSFVLNVNAKKAQIAVGTQQIVVAGKPTIRERIGDLTLDLSANSFFQTNTLQAARLYDTVAALAELEGTETVYDLYCGAGSIALYLSGRARFVLGVEAAQEAVQDAAHNARLNGVRNCKFVRGEVETVLQGPRNEPPPQVVIVDPPRAGLHERAIRGLVDLAAPRIIYVSCNPESMARNVLALSVGGYALGALQPVDMFPHTHHVECVAVLDRSR